MTHYDWFLGCVGRSLNYKGYEASMDMNR